MDAVRNASFHLMYTPKVTQGRVGGDASTGGGKMSAISPTAGFSSVDVVDALTYYFENVFNAELPANSSSAARRVQWETSSLWKLMIEMFRMEALNERLHDIPFSSANPIRDTFTKSKEFRRLMAMIRWCHWVNCEETEPSVLSDISNSDSKPIDQILNDPKSIHPSAVQREKQLCRNIWIYLTQGRIADAIDLCSTSGHNWRAGVLHASCGHEFLGDSVLDDVQDIQPDWVECEVISELLASIPSQDNSSRMNVKRIASLQPLGIDEYDSAINAFICGNEEGMRRVASTPSLALWAGLHAIKENFVAKILSDSTHDETALGDSIEGLIVSLTDTMDLDSSNQLKSLQLTFARQDFAQCVSTCHDWINDGIIRLENFSVDIDLTSTSVDGTATVLLRQFACSFCNLIEMLVAKKKLAETIALDIGKINTIVLGNIECLIAQFKGTLTGLMEGNDVIVDNLNLVRNEVEDVKTKTWAWYFRQYMNCGLEFVGPENILGFSPLSSLLESEPSRALEVLRLVLCDVVTKRSEFVLTHALGASIEAGHDVGFAVCLVNGMWLVAQSGAKSTGSGIYCEIVQNNDPEEAATAIVVELSSMIGEGLALLVLADFQLARSVADVMMNQVPAGISSSRLITIHAAMDAIQDDDSDNPDLCGVVVSVIRILDRVTGLMERNSLLEQQRSNMKRLSGKSSGSSGSNTVAVSTDIRRQIIDTQRLIDTTLEMVVKMSDDIISGVSEVVSSDECPIDLGKSVVGIERNLWGRIGTALIDVLLESSVQAVALVDDRRRQETLLHAVKSSPWLLSVLSEKRLREILEEIA